MLLIGQNSIIYKSILKHLLLNVKGYLFRLDLINTELLATETRARLSPAIAPPTASFCPRPGNLV